MSSLAKAGEIGARIEVGTIFVDSVQARVPDFMGYNDYTGLIISNAVNEPEDGQEIGDPDIVYTDRDGDIINFADITNTITVYMAARLTLTGGADVADGILVQILDDDGDPVDQAGSYRSASKNTQFPSGSDETNGIVLSMGVVDSPCLVYFKMTLHINADQYEGYLLGEYQYFVVDENEDPVNDYFSVGFNKFLIVSMPTAVEVRGLRISLTNAADSTDTYINTKVITN